MLQYFYFIFFILFSVIMVQKQNEQLFNDELILEFSSNVRIDKVYVSTRL